MNNPIGMCFPDFIGLRPLGLPFSARPGGKKYRSAARMIFSCPAKPARAALPQKAGNPRPLPLKSGKTASFFTGKKNADLPACILLVGMSGMSDLLGSIGVEYIIGHFHGESPDSVQEFLSGRHSVFKSGKLLFPLPG